MFSPLSVSVSNIKRRIVGLNAGIPKYPIQNMYSKLLKNTNIKKYEQSKYTILGVRLLKPYDKLV